MTCVIIQWVFNLHPILVIGKRHHLAFIKVEGDAFSLFAWTDSGRETCRAANTQAHGSTSRLAGRRAFEGFISSIWTPPLGRNISHNEVQAGWRQSQSPRRTLPCHWWGQWWGCGGSCLSFPHSLPGVGSSVFCKSLGLSTFLNLAVWNRSLLWSLARVRPNGTVVRLLKEP